MNKIERYFVEFGGEDAEMILLTAEPGAIKHFNEPPPDAYIEGDDTWNVVDAVGWGNGVWMVRAFNRVERVMHIWVWGGNGENLH